MTEVAKIIKRVSVCLTDEGFVKTQVMTGDDKRTWLRNLPKFLCSSRQIENLAMADPAAAEEAVLNQLGDEARKWIEGILGAPLPTSPEEGLHAALRDGVALCELVRKLQPGMCQKPSQSSKPFQQMENLATYLRACEALGVPSHDLFTTIDCFENRNMKAVVRNIHSLGRVVQQQPGYAFPTLGARLATKTPRNFGEAKWRQVFFFVGGGV